MQDMHRQIFVTCQTCIPYSSFNTVNTVMGNCNLQLPQPEVDEPSFQFHLVSHNVYVIQLRL